jgi:hypothetical protein
LKKIFLSYSHKDETLREALEVHLALLKNQGVIEIWHDRKIGAGNNLDESINANLDEADVILLLVSPDFLASKYCWGVEVKRAMERHSDKSARVIPVILRPCDWQSAPFGNLLAAPKDGKPVRSWNDIDEALYDVSLQIRAALNELGAKASARSISSAKPARAVENNVSTTYCAYCGVRAGTQTVCSGSRYHHDFKRSDGPHIFCKYCGVRAGTQSVCSGSRYHHDFEVFEHQPFCTYCGQLAGTQTVCTGSRYHHDFK